MKPIYTRNRNGRCTAADRDGNRFSQSSTDLQYEEGHKVAAAGLMRKMGWTGTIRGHQSLRSGQNDGMIWVYDDDRAPVVTVD